MKQIKINLSLADLKDLSLKISDLQKELPKCEQKIKRNLAEYTQKQIDINLAGTTFRDGNEDTESFIEEDNNKIKVGMKGTQALYNEFGTGTRGEESPHPEKSKFGLKGYNTGKTIQPDRNGNLVWWYYKEGVKHYTNGIPAGLQVFNASQSLKSKKKEIIKKEVGDLLSKL